MLPFLQRRRQEAINLLSLQRLNRGRVLDLDTRVGAQRLTDRSRYGNNAILNTGVYFSTDGLTDKGINADCSAAGSGTYKLIGKVRSSSTGTKYVTMDGATADTLTVNTADVWQDFESSSFTGTPSNVVCGWDGGSNFSACDWSNVQLIDTSDGSTVSHFQGNESGAGDLDGKLVVDSSGNGYHGQHIGCAGGSGEPDILQTAGQNANPWMGFTGWENGEDIESNEPTLTDVLLADRYSSTAGVNYDAVTDADGIGGANSGNYCLKVTTPEALRGMAFVTPADDTTRQFELYYYVPTGQPNLELGNNDTMALVPTLVSGNLTTKDAWTKIIFEWRVGVGNPGTAPWIGPAGAAGTVYFDDITITNPSIYVPQLDTDSTVDALGFPIAKPRPNDKVINLLADNAKATVAADASMDATKSVEGWVYYDGTDQTFLDIGTPIINSSSDVLGSTLAGTLTYYVNGVATTALGSAGWKHIAITSDTVQATDAIDILATSSAWKKIDRTLTATEVLARFNTSKFEYGFYYLRPDGSAILRPDGSQYIRPL